MRRFANDGTRDSDIVQSLLRVDLQQSHTHADEMEGSSSRVPGAPR